MLFVFFLSLVALASASQVSSSPQAGAFLVTSYNVYIIGAEGASANTAQIFFYNDTGSAHTLLWFLSSPSLVRSQCASLSYTP